MEEKMSEENNEEVMLLEAQIEHLQAEVTALQHQQQDNHKDITFHLRGQMQDAMWVKSLIWHSLLNLYHTFFYLL